MEVTLEREEILLEDRIKLDIKQIVKLFNHKENLIFFEGTLDDFYNIEEEKVEFIDGGIIVLQSPASIEHEDIFGDLYSKMRLYASEKNLGRVLGSRVTIALDRDHKFEPDILFILKANKGIFTEYEFIGVPDLVVEIISKTTRNYDLKTKREIYRMHKIKEIYFIDYIKKMIIIDILEKEGYKSVNLKEDNFESKVLDGFKFYLRF
jgi:Uma2 family endonuclease